MSQTISTAQFAQELGKPDLVVVDVRPMAAFNGWQLKGEDRGGHIRGAIACPAFWSQQMGRHDLTALMESKGIKRDKTVVVYGYADGEPAAVAELLEGLGYTKVLLYEGGLEAWAADDRLPMSRLPRYEKLVHPEWVYRLIDGQQPVTYPGVGFSIFHVNFGVPEDYREGHIPGAMHLDTNALESASTWNRRSAKELEAALRAHGITRDKTIVLYGRHADPDPRDPDPGRRAGQIAATRAAAILMYAGVEDVRVLDGGFGAWLSAGYPVETEVHTPPPVPASGLNIPVRPELLIDMDEAKALLADPNGVLVSMRSWSEYIGDSSGYHYIGPKGRIPGAVWGNCGTDAYHMQQYRNFDNTMREFHEIKANWQQVGIVSEKRVAFYCGTGWRASESLFYAHVMGWERIAVYDGGWFEWSNDGSNRIETGEP